MAMKKLSDFKLTDIRYRFKTKLAYSRFGQYTLYFEVIKGSGRRSRKVYSAGCQSFASKAGAIKHWEYRKREATKELASLKEAQVKTKETRKKWSSLIKKYGLGPIHYVIYSDGELRSGAWFSIEEEAIIAELRNNSRAELKDLYNATRSFNEYRAQISDWNSVLQRAEIFLAALKSFPEERILKKYAISN